MPYKGGNKETVKYSVKPSNSFCYDIKGLNSDYVKSLVSDKIENKFITGKVEYKSKLVKTGKSKTVKTSSTGLTGYKKYTGINQFDKNEKKYLGTIKPVNMVHLKDVKSNDKNQGMFHYFYSDSVYLVSSLNLVNINQDSEYVNFSKNKLEKNKCEDKIFTVTNKAGESIDRLKRPYGYWLDI